MLAELAKRVSVAHGLEQDSEVYNGRQVISMEGSGSGLVDLMKSKTWNLLDRMITGLDRVPVDGDYLSFLECYAAVPWLYTAGWTIAASISSLPLQIMEGPKKDAKEVDKGTVIDLFEAPNQFDTFNSLLEFLVLNLEFTGNAYIEKKDIFQNLPIALFGLESFNMTVIPDPVKKIKGYKYTVSGQDADFTIEQIIHLRYANPLNQFYGQGVIKALQATIITELLRETYNKNFFENEARPDVILKQNPDIQKGVMPVIGEDLRETAAKWRDSFGGPKKNRLPVVLPAGFDIELLTETIQDMHYREFEKSLRERIIGATGVPPAMMGLFEYANYANSREQIKIFWTVTVPPKLRIIANSITRGLLKPYNENLWCQFDTSDIPALEEDPKDKRAGLLGEYINGVINKGMYREKMGYGKDPSDKYSDRYVMQQSLVPQEDVFEGGGMLEEPGFGTSPPAESTPTFTPSSEPSEREEELEQKKREWGEDWIYLIHHLHDDKDNPEDIEEVHHCPLFSKKDMKGLEYSQRHKEDRGHVLHTLDVSVDKAPKVVYDHLNNGLKVKVREVDGEKLVILDGLVKAKAVHSI